MLDKLPQHAIDKNNSLKELRISHEVSDLINERIPKSILEAMNTQGWNAAGIYQVVLDEIKREKKREKKRK